MDIDISLVPAGKKHVLRNMLELYFYDCCEFDDEEDSLELNEAGLYGYRYLDYYWNEDDRYPYIVKVNGNLAGFSLIRTLGHEPLTFSISEFFVMKKYRNIGIGAAMSTKMFELHKGKWIINTPIKNITAQHFWRKAAKNASLGVYDEYLIDNGRRMEWGFDNSGCCGINAK
ncbi:MAG: GNAT family N-acetyltransferase [Defluviitaleaceae bacterium]|nr:GNAT family N-acetyltransferase [Defluviitaleaceae bacterium]